MYSLYHGLSAYNREDLDTDDNLFCKACLAENRCCSWSDIPIGPLGLFADFDSITWVDGGCHHDCYSNLNEIGQRYSTDPDYQSWDTCLFDDQRDFMEAISNMVDRNAKNPAYRYAEFFVTSHADAIWVNPKFGKRFIKMAETLAYNMDLPLIFI